MTIAEKQSSRKLKSDQEHGQRISLYRQVFGSTEGQAVLADLSKAAGLTSRVFMLADKGDHSAYDPLKAALKDGGRDVIIRIHEILSSPIEEEKPKPKVKKS